MEKIPSFTINHMKLLPGIYVSRKDNVSGNILTTFDIRVTRPNFEMVMDTDEMHAMEHLGATFLRNHNEFGDKIIYFGPMGCRTGFYLIVNGNYSSKDISHLVKELFIFIENYEGDIPGATAKDCGNYSDMDLDKAKKRAHLFYNNILENISDLNLNYPS